MTIAIKHIIRFFLFALIQVLVLNQIEIGWGIQLMIYPVFIMLLPVELSVFYLLLISFLFGMFIDSMSNSYGLHTSALLLFAYLRPLIFKVFAPRDGYDILLEPNIFNMGKKWFYKTFGILLLIHHFWFFLLEIFKLNEILFVTQKTILSFIFSMLLCVLVQYLFIRNSKNNAI
jgi:hypothetical protein